MKKTVLITGASSGIGLEFAEIFAKNGDNVILVARSCDKLNEIKEVGELLNKFKVAECEETNNNRNYEVRVKQMHYDNVDKTVGHTLAALGLLASVGMGYWTFRFDEKGTITSTLGRQILQRFIPRK